MPVVRSCWDYFLGADAHLSVAQCFSSLVKSVARVLIRCAVYSLGFFSWATEAARLLFRALCLGYVSPEVGVKMVNLSL